MARKTRIIPPALASTSSLLARLERSVPWMTTLLNALIWRLKGIDQSDISVNFDQPLSDTANLLDPSRESTLATVILTIEAHAADLGYGPNAGANIAPLARQFFSLLRYLETRGLPLSSVGEDVAFEYAKFIRDTVALKRGAVLGDTKAERDVRELVTNEEDDDADVDDDEELADEPYTGISTNTLQSMLRPLQLLWLYRDRLPLSLAGDPFPESTGAVCRRLGTKARIGRLIPLAQGCALLAGSIHLVKVVGPLSLDARDIQKANQAGKASREEVDVAISHINNELRGAAVTVVSGPRAYTSPECMSLNNVIANLLPTAAFALMMAFGVRRPIEVRRIKTDALTGTPELGHWMRFYIAKNYQRDESVAVPPLLADAFRLLMRITELRRETYPSDYVCTSRGSFGDPHLIALDSKRLNSLAAVLKVPDSEDGPWSFLPQQFRRFSAVLWVYRFEEPVAALSVTMFHFNWFRTSGYLQSPSMRSWIAQDQRRLTIAIVEGIASSFGEYAGPQTARYKRMVGRLRVAMHLSLKDAAKYVAGVLVRELDLIVSPCAWGFCLARRRHSNLKRAKCLKEGVGKLDATGRPDSTASNAGICCGCPFFASHSSRLPYLEYALENSKAIVSHPLTKPDVRNLAHKRVVHLQRVVSDLNAMKE